MEIVRVGSDIEVFNLEDKKIAVLGFSGNARLKRQLMGEHYLLMTFNWNTVLNFNRGDYVDLETRRYTLRELNMPTIESRTGAFEYELKFEAIEMFFQDVPFFYLFQGLEEVEWSLMRKSISFLEIAVECINKYLGFEEDEKFKVGECMDTEMMDLSFSSENVFDGMTQVAETFAGEWYIGYEDRTLNLVKSYEVGEPIELKREVQLTDIKKVNENDEDYYNRLYAFGSSRNIPTNYRSAENGEVVDAIVQKKLRLPISQGDYIDAVPGLKPIQIIPKPKIFEHIYPKRIGTITELRIDDTQKDENDNPWLIYYFKDSGLKFDSKYILEGKTLSVTFESNSWLSGRTFELGYNDKTEEFEIVNDQSITNLTVPNETLRPKLGDNFILFNFDISLVGDQYVAEAEQELLQEAKEWMDSIQEDNATYECSMNPVLVHKEEFAMKVGQRVKLVSLLFKDGYKDSRIFGYGLDIVGCRDVYTVGIKPKYSRLRNIDTTIEENKKVADVQYLEAMKAAKGALKTAKALNYLRIALENETSIEGGLILTTLIRLGYMLDGKWTETSGINGVDQGENDVAIWAGGNIDQAINAANDPSRIDDVAQFVVTHLGKLIANDVHMRGKFETNYNGDRIVIDPENNSLKMIGSNGEESAGLYFTNNMSMFRLRSKEGVATMYPYGIHLEDNSTSSKKVNLSNLSIGLFNANSETEFRAGFGPTDTLEIIMRNLPKNAYGLKDGQLWLNNGKLELYELKEE